MFALGQISSLGQIAPTCCVEFIKRLRSKQISWLVLWQISGAFAISPVISSNGTAIAYHVVVPVIEEIDIETFCR